MSICVTAISPAEFMNNLDSYYFENASLHNNIPHSVLKSYLTVQQTTKGFGQETIYMVSGYRFDKNLKVFFQKSFLSNDLSPVIGFLGEVIIPEFIIPIEARDLKEFLALTSVALYNYVGLHPSMTKCGVRDSVNDAWNSDSLRNLKGGLVDLHITDGGLLEYNGDDDYLVTQLPSKRRYLVDLAQQSGYKARRLRGFTSEQRDWVLNRLSENYGGKEGKDNDYSTEVAIAQWLYWFDVGLSDDYCLVEVVDESGSTKSILGFFRMNLDGKPHFTFASFVSEKEKDMGSISLLLSLPVLYEHNENTLAGTDVAADVVIDLGASREPWHNGEAYYGAYKRNVRTDKNVWRFNFQSRTHKEFDEFIPQEFFVDTRQWIYTTGKMASADYDYGMFSRFRRLGILDAKELKRLYRDGTVLAKNMSRRYWENCVETTNEQYDDTWNLFSQPVFEYTLESGELLHLQQTVHTMQSIDTFTSIGSDWVSDWFLDITEQDYLNIMELVSKVFRSGYSHINNFWKMQSGRAVDTCLKGTTDLIRYRVGDTVEEYMQSQKSKKRSNVNKALRKAAGFKYQEIARPVSSDTLWILSHLIRNFGDSGFGAENNYDADYSLIQWYPIITASLNDPDVRIVRIHDAGDKIVGYCAFLIRPNNFAGINDEWKRDTIIDFRCYVQDSSYKGVGSALLLKSIELICDQLDSESGFATILLETAPLPGSPDDRYYSYKKDCGNQTWDVYSALATSPTADIKIPGTYNGKLEEWI